MKKKLILLFALIFSLSCLFSVSWDTDVKQRSMSLKGVADSFSLFNFFFNPASVYSYNQDSTFILSSGIADSIDPKNEGILNKPENYLKAEFISNRISFAFDTNLKVTENRKNGNSRLYNLKRDVTFNFNVATGVGDFAVGTGIYGGSGMGINNVSNLLYQSILGEFERLEDSQFISVRAGVLYKLQQVAFGLTADQILSYDVEKNEMTLDKAIDYISVGTYWSESKYAKRGRLKEWVMDAGIELLNIFNSSERTVSIGGEAILQLANEYSISFRTGASLPTGSVSDTSHSFGIGVRLGMFDVSLCGSMPVTNYIGRNNPISYNFNLSIIK